MTIRHLALVGADALSSLLQRPGRLALTVSGTFLGLASFVATLGLASTSASQVGAEFDELKATEVILRDTGSEHLTALTPAYSDVEQIAGVIASGMGCALGGHRPEVRRAGVPGFPPVDVTILLVTPGFLEAAEATLVWGRLLNPVDSAFDSGAVVLGSGAATRLGITSPQSAPRVELDGEAMSVVGVVDHASSRPEVLNSVLIPVSETDFVAVRCETPLEVLIRTDLGAAESVGEFAPVVISPREPERFQAQVPPDPRLLRDRIESGVLAVYLAMAVVALAVGALSIANILTISVLERRSEIGLRRALGSTRSDIAIQFLIEAGVVGGLGGILGSSAGVLIVSAVSLLRGWGAVIEPAVMLGAPFIGVMTGMLGGAVPAVRAARVDPASALRS